MVMSRCIIAVKGVRMVMMSISASPLMTTIRVNQGGRCGPARQLGDQPHYPGAGEGLLPAAAPAV